MHKFFGPIVVFFFVHSSNTNAGPLYFTQMSEVQVTLNEQYTYLTENSAHALIYSPAQVPDGSLMDSPFAMVCFAHGAGSHFRYGYYDLWARLIASYGFHVIIPDFSNEVSTSLGGIERSRLQRESCNTLRALAQNPSSPYYGKVRTDAMAIMGYSWGGVANLVSYAEDPEVDALVMMDNMNPLFNWSDYESESLNLKPWEQSPKPILRLLSGKGFAEDGLARGYPGPQISVMFVDAVHGFALDPDSPGAGDFALSQVNRAVGAEVMARFLWRFLNEDLEQDQALFSDEPRTWLPTGSTRKISYTIYRQTRPEWTIDNFSDAQLGSNSLGLPVQFLTPTRSWMGPPLAHNSATPTFFWEPAAQEILEHPSLRHLNVRLSGNHCVTENLNGTLGAAVTPQTQFRFEAGVMSAEAFSSRPELKVKFHLTSGQIHEQSVFLPGNPMTYQKYYSTLRVPLSLMGIASLAEVDKISVCGGTGAPFRNYSLGNFRISYPD